MFWRYAKRILATLAVIVLVVFSLAAVVTKARHGSLLSVQSGSMVPHFHKGDLVSVTRVPVASLRPGDIITFMSPKNKKVTITHRIRELPNADHPGMFVTKGDANPASDQPIPAASIIGRAGWSVPYLGYLADFIRKPVGLALIIYIPALAIMWEELRRLMKYYEQQRPYILAGYGHAAEVSAKSKKLMSAIKFGLMLVLAAILGLVVPVHALLASRATLRGNTISATLVNQTHIEISELNLRCSPRDTADASQFPLIMLYNPSAMRISLKGWTLRDNSGTILTFAANRTLIKHQIYVISLYLPKGGLSGLQYAGDHLGLYTDGGQEVDGLSWGSDVSEFDPSIQGITPGTDLHRKPIGRDTNTAADWIVKDHHCAGEPRNKTNVTTASNISDAFITVPDQANDSTDNQMSVQVIDPQTTDDYTIKPLDF